jgi:hypothetical protein
VWLDTVPAQGILQSTHRLLACTYHHVAHGEHLWAASVRAEADVQAVVGDPLVVDPNGDSKVGYGSVFGYGFVTMTPVPRAPTIMG